MNHTCGCERRCPSVCVLVSLGMDVECWRPKHRAIRFVLQALIRLAFAFLTKLTIEGQEHLPSHGPVLLVANHFHFADPVAVIRAMPWPLDFIGGFRLPNAPTGVKWLTRAWGTMRVRRGGSSRGALKDAEHTLRQGGAVGIFPEGGSWASVLRPGRPGAAYLATRSGALVVPIGLDGVTEMFSALCRGRRARIAIRIGQPLGPFPEAPRGRAGRVVLEGISETIMKSIAELIPPHRRGVFSADARVREAAQAAAVYPWEQAGKDKSHE